MKLLNENRLQTPFESQNRNIYILDKKQIEALPVQSINELLSYVTGVDVRQRGPWGAQADISIDGGTKSTVSIPMQSIYLTHNIEVATAPMPGRWFSLGLKAGREYKKPITKN